MIVGAGAAGLMAAIVAATHSRSQRVVVLEGAGKIGAKILISGGGRCNVTHDTVDESSFSGSTPPAIRKVLRRFDVAQTVDFFAQCRVKLKREETGKLFPVTDRAITVLDALLKAVGRSGAEILKGRRVDGISRVDDYFVIQGKWGTSRAGKVVLATGGQSVPATGSDGHGYKWREASDIR